MFKELFQKTLKLAAHKSSKFFLALISFVESSFFPIPPDILIVPMVIAKKNDYIKIFVIATLFSALGGLFGYFIGSVFLEFAMKVIEFYGYEQNVFDLQTKLSEKGGLFIDRDPVIFQHVLEKLENEPNEPKILENIDAETEKLV